jgi:hypothetical protein
MPTSYSTRPSIIQQSTLETIAWSVDVSAEVTQSSGPPSTPSSAMLDKFNGLGVALSDAPTLNGNLVSQIVRGSALTPGHSYRLSFVVVIAGNVLDHEVTLQCLS